MNIYFDGRGISEKIREKRDGELSLRKAAGVIGVSASTLCRVENKKEPDVVSLFKICAWLKIPMEGFFIIKKSK